MHQLKLILNKNYRLIDEFWNIKWPSSKSFYVIDEIFFPFSDYDYVFVYSLLVRIMVNIFIQPQSTKSRVEENIRMKWLCQNCNESYSFVLFIESFFFWILIDMKMMWAFKLVDWLKCLTAVNYLLLIDSHRWLVIKKQNSKQLFVVVHWSFLILFQYLKKHIQT